jgi:SAM-dependent methyltransferase
VPLAPQRLREIIVELASRPGHEKVRALVYQLLVDGLDASSTEVDFERPVPEVHGRIDALLGRTVFEFKSDLRREGPDAKEQLSRYLLDRETVTGERYVGVATDGAEFAPYELRRGSLRSLPQFASNVQQPRDLLVWLGASVAVSADLPPESEVVRRELGRDSLSWHRARKQLAEAWDEVAGIPDVRLKRELWARLLERVYGSSVDADDLFFQHTYLSAIAKTMAVHVLGIDVPGPRELLAGRPFQEAGIGGAVESDFFDWVLASDLGQDLVRRIALQAGRFRLREVQSDVLKGLYESLVDPEQRHDLGEYYTPDWLAQRMCEAAIQNPLEQRVLDPACGSGTFLFHAVRRLLAAADQAGLGYGQAIERACRQVLGVDIHPVAVQIARVTYLLALGEERLARRPGPITLPVYLGDSLQWNTRGFLAEREVLIEVPGQESLLEFPFEVARDPVLFDGVISHMLELSEQDSESGALEAWLDRTHTLSPGTGGGLVRTYQTLRELHRNRRNHIWGFVARNLVRPVWLSQEEQRADVVIGNPPWLPYREMAEQTQRQFREECQRLGIWMAQVAQQQDLSGYFFVRCVERYLKPTGVITFVMPYAAMSRRQFADFREGIYGPRQGGRVRDPEISIRFTQAWAFSDDVQPLFQVPSCVLFAETERKEPQGARTSRLPQTVLAAAGSLPRRDATLNEAESRLHWDEVPWPSQRRGRYTTGYASIFRDGAVVFPTVLFRVEVAEAGRLGPNPTAPLIQSRRSSQEKAPWKNLGPLRGNVEAEFLRTLYLGESIGPFRLLNPILAVVPWDVGQGGLLDSSEAQRKGYAYLARWLSDAERLWTEHGRGRRTLTEQLDYYGQLSAQFPVPPLRVVYAASGTLPAAALLLGESAIVEHNLYWMRVTSLEEARYLLGILNSETGRLRAENLQSRGQWGARHFDKVMLSLPIPLFDPAEPLHRELALEAARAVGVAAQVEVPQGTHFVRARRLIRAALQEDGVAQRIDRLVAALLG